MTAENALSLIDYCQPCGSKCCKNDSFLISEDEHTRIAESNAPDYFWHITIPTGRYFYLDYRSGSCPYLASTGQCTIQSVKAKICNTYPIKHLKADGTAHVDEGCPAANNLPREFVHQTIDFIGRNPNAIDTDGGFAALDAFELRNAPPALQEAGTYVMPPPAYRL